MRGRALRLRAVGEERIELWLHWSAVIGVVLLGASLAGLQKLKLPTPQLVIAAGLAVTIGIVIPLLIGMHRDRLGQRGQLVRQLREDFQRMKGLAGPRVRDFAAYKLGVTPAAVPSQLAVHAPLDAPPAYMRRDIDGDPTSGVPGELDVALRSPGLVLIEGDSRAGKSRTASEAMQRLFPNRLLLVPTGKASLPKLVKAELLLPDAVIWLDGLEKISRPRNRIRPGRAYCERLGAADRHRAATGAAG